MTSTINLTARQSNKVEWPPVDLRPKGGFSAVPIEPGVNWFAPMNTRLVNGRAPAFSNREQRKDLFAVGLKGIDAIPKAFDWRDPASVRQLTKYKNLSDAQILGFLNPVFNQGQCGSCWAVSSTMALSDRFAIQTAKKYIPMDINNVLSCAESAGDNGCGGGYMQNAGHYFEKNGTTAACFPYNGSMQVGPSCSSVQQQCGSKEKFYVKSGSVREFRGDIDQIQSDIMNNGPVVAGYQVDSSFMTYKGGVFVQPQNMNVVGGHAVAIVGWGFDDKLGRGYWIVRNSWGEQWGERGYFRFAWSPTPGRQDQKYLENWTVSFQPKINVRGGDDNKDDPEPTPPNPEPSPPEPQPPKPRPTPVENTKTAIVALSVTTGVALLAVIILAILLGTKRTMARPF